MTSYLDLFLTFARIGAFTFGGGYAMLSLLQREIVEEKHWATDAQLADYFAIGQCTPGIIAVNTATFIGRSQRGILGAICASVGLILPSMVIITLLASVLQSFSHLPAVAHAFGGIRACVVALIFSSILKLGKAAVKDKKTAGVFITILTLSLLGSYLVLLPAVVKKMTSPAVLILLAGTLGYFLYREERVNE